MKNRSDFKLLLNRGATSAYAAYAVALDFNNSQYWMGGINYASANLLPGYAFTRTNEQGAIASDGTVSYYATNIPAINNTGYHAYGALTNYVQQSQSFGSSPWATFSGATLDGSNTAVAPDGTLTADRITIGNAGSGTIFYQPIAGPTGKNTLSIWVKAVSGTARFRLYTLVGGTNQYSTDFVATTTWQRFSFVHDAGGTSASQFAIAAPASGNGGQFDVWQAQQLGGDFSDGGPLIRTAGATASIGASAFDTNSPLSTETDFLFYAVADLPPSGLENNIAMIRNGDARYQLTRDSGGGVTGNVYDNSSFTSTWTTLNMVNAGRLVVAFRRLSGVMKVYAYYNSTHYSASIGASLWFNPNNLRIGRSEGGGNLTNGSVDGVFVRLGTFSDAEVQAILAAA